MYSHLKRGMPNFFAGSTGEIDARTLPLLTLIFLAVRAPTCIILSPDFGEKLRIDTIFASNSSSVILV